MRVHPWLIVAAIASSVVLARTTSNTADIDDTLAAPSQTQPSALGGGPVPRFDPAALDASRASVANELLTAEQPNFHATCANHTGAAERAGRTTSVSNGTAEPIDAN